MNTIKTKMNNDNGGYAILFTVVIIGIISMITIGLSDSAYKQTILSSLVKDSTISFYQADIGSECALYADNSNFFRDDQSAVTFNCAEQNLKFSKIGVGDYQLNPVSETATTKCFRIEIGKVLDIINGGINTTVKTKGYNKCLKTNNRTVERGILVSYNGGAQNLILNTNDGLYYGTVIAEDGKTWLDRNLGATQVATSFNDAASYGYFYQWGRGVDGHQIKTSGTTSTLSFTDVPLNANFITTTSDPFDWRSPYNDNLWQGGSGINNPCPTGFRLPTYTELTTITTTIGLFPSFCAATSTCREVAYASILKLPSSGSRTNNGIHAGAGNTGGLWSSEVIGGAGGSIGHLMYGSNFSFLNNWPRGYSENIRCIAN